MKINTKLTKVSRNVKKQKGFINPINIEGGFEAIREQQNINLTEFVCPTEL